MPQVPTRLDLAPTTLDDGQEYDLSIWQGDDYELELDVPIDGVLTDLSGATGLSQIRSRDLATVLGTLTMTLDADQGANPGKLVLAIADTATDGITANAVSPLVAADESTMYYWDFELTFGGEVHTVLRGYVNVYPQVSKP